MIVARSVWRAKFGQADALVRLFQESHATWSIEIPWSIMTDLSGPFFTVVTEGRYQSFTDYEAASEKIFADPRFAAWFERMVPLIDGGSREFYTLVE